jgi:signal transduction histidine kinase
MTVRTMRFLSSLQARFLLALVLIGLFPLGTIGQIVVAQAHQALAEQSARELTGLAQGLGAHLEASVEQLLSDCRAMAALPDIASMDTARQDALLKVLYQHRQDYARLSVFDRAGQRLASSHPGGAPSIAERSSFQIAAGRGEQAWEIAPALSTGRTSLLIHTPIRNEQRRVVGVLGAVVDLASLSMLVRHVADQSGARPFVLDGRGAVLLHPDPEVVQEQRDYTWLGIPSHGRLPGPGVVRYRVGGEQFIASYVPLPTTNWTVVVERPEAVVMAPAERWRRLAISGLMASAALAVLGAVLLARTLTRPVRLLAAAARALGAGELSAPLPPTASASELSPLINAFAEMRANLAARTAERERLISAQHFLAEASAILASTLDYEATLAHVAQLTVPQLADWCVVDILDRDGVLRRLAVAHADPSGTAQARLLQELAGQPEVPAVAEVIQAGRAVLYTQISDDLLASVARDAEHLQTLRALGVRSAMIVPLVVRGRTLGGIVLVSAQSGRRYGPEDLAQAEELARRCAQAIDNARLYDAAQEGLRVRDEFLSTAAHELKTPISVIKGYVELLRRRLAAGRPLHETQVLEVLERQCNRLTRLIQDFLDVARAEYGQLELRSERCDLAALVRAVVERLQATTSAHCLELCVIASAPVVVDRDRIEQVVENLLSNAIKYSPGGGHIWVTVDVLAGEAVVSVRDEGVGIPSDRQARLFERFYRAHAGTPHDYGGMGIGLHLSREIVVRHGGRMGFSSIEGEGSTFSFSVPVCSRQAMSGDSDDVGAEAGPAGRG